MAWNPFSFPEEQQIIEAINTAEKTCSGEIRVHVERYCKSNTFVRAQRAFEELGMTETELRNGVLIFVGLEDHRFAILGDVGINNLVEDNFWDEIKDKMTELFKNGQTLDAICLGIEMAGKELSKYFPPSGNDTNELPDTISYGS